MHHVDPKNAAAHLTREAAPSAGFRSLAGRSNATLGRYRALSFGALVFACGYAGCGGGDSSSDTPAASGAAGDSSQGGTSESGGKSGSTGAAGHAGAAAGHAGSAGASGAAGKSSSGGNAGASGHGTGGKAGSSGTGGATSAGGAGHGGSSSMLGAGGGGMSAAGAGGQPTAGPVGAGGAAGQPTQGPGGAGGQAAQGPGGAGGDANGGNAGTDAAGGFAGDTSAGGTGTAGTGDIGGSAGSTTTPTGQSWVWVYTDWTASATAITTHASSFTHISPTFYDLNAKYSGGLVPYWNCSTGNPCKYEGKTPAEYTAELTKAGLLVVPAIYAGGANSGTDSNVQDILNDKNGEAESFISAMVTEAVTQGYAGYNLDWELSATGSSYADKFVTFVNDFKAAMAPHGLILTADAIVSNVNGTWCSSNDGYLDFAKLGASSIDSIIVEDYTASLGAASTSCNTVKLSSSNPASCPVNSDGSDVLFTGVLDFMCSNLPYDKVVIGMQSDSTNTNPIAGAAFTAMEAYGFKSVAVWPQAETSEFMSSKGLKASQSDWYGVLAAFLTH